MSGRENGLTGIYNNNVRRLREMHEHKIILGFKMRAFPIVLHVVHGAAALAAGIPQLLYTVYELGSHMGTACIPVHRVYAPLHACVNCRTGERGQDYARTVNADPALDRSAKTADMYSSRTIWACICVEVACVYMYM